MSETFPQIYERHVVESPDARNWGCMDDRPVDLEVHPVLNLPFYQTPGGASGLANDFAVSCQMNRPKRILPMPVHRYANHIADVVVEKGIHIYNHALCAAQLGQTAVARTITEEIEDLLTTADDLGLEHICTEERGTIMQEAYQRLETANKFAPPPEALKEMEQPKVRGGGTATPIPTLKLIDSPHAGEAALIDLRPDVSFDTRSAFYHGKPAYYSSIANLKKIYDAAGMGRVVELPDFIASALIRKIAIVKYHLKAPDDSPLGLHVAQPSNGSMGL